MRRIFPPLIFFLVLGSGALDLHCNVSQQGLLTTYRIRGPLTTGCDYWWTNETKYTLANQDEEAKDPVVKQNITSLTVKGCMETVHYNRNCISEDTLQETLCTVSCSKDVGQLRGAQKTHMYWITGAVSALALMVLVITIVRCGRASSKKKELENFPL